MTLSKMTPRLMGKCTLTPRTSTSTSRSPAAGGAGVVAVSVIGSPHGVVAAQGPARGLLELRGRARAHVDRLRAARGEGAGVVPRQVVGHRPGDGGEPLTARRVEPGDRAEQAVGVRVAGVGEQLVTLPALDDASGVQHVDLVAQARDDPEVVG